LRTERFIHTILQVRFMKNTYKLIWPDEALKGLKEIIEYLENKFPEKT